MLPFSLRAALLPMLCVFALTGCGGDSSDDDTPSQIRGNIRSADTDVINVNHNINALLSSTCDRSTFLYQAAVLPAGAGRFDPSRWSLVFRSAPDISGTLVVGEEGTPEIHLHTNYVARATQTGSGCQLTETKSDSYVATSGSITFNGHGDAQFTLYFREVDTRTTPVEVKGCWLVSRDGRQCQNATSEER